MRQTPYFGPESGGMTLAEIASSRRQREETMEPTDRLTVTLTAQEWNTLMTVMGEAPFKTVASLIGQIQSQCAMQDRRRAMMDAVSNGAVPGHAGSFPRVVEPDGAVS
jgi:hypothetical protein